ncbi:hypothetical protein [Methanobrevibacter woesei]|uniref:hypothetical protein n=1 Tax=Methanobrevibacter woesei TaxID=190976 RepID=UPI00320A5781
MYDHKFDGDSFDFLDMDVFYDAFDAYPEHRRKELLKYIHDLDSIKYNNFVEIVLSRHPDYDPEKYQIED